MTTATVLQFMQKTAEDEALRQQLENLLGVGDGNISSETELDASESEALEERAPVVADFAAKHGFTFSADELIAVVDAFQKHQAGEISNADFVTTLGISPADEGIRDDMAQTGNRLNRLMRYLTRTYLGY